MYRYCPLPGCRGKFAPHQSASRTASPSGEALNFFMQMLLPGVVDGQGHCDGRAAAEGGGDVEPAAERLDDLIHDRKADTGAAHRVLCLEEPLLDLFQIIGRNAAGRETVKTESTSVMVAFDFDRQESVTVPERWRRNLAD